MIRRLEDIIKRVTPVHYPTAICAHRGDSSMAPENTLSAFELALSAKVEMVELDILRTGDGEIVVIHDKSLDRTTDGAGDVASLSLAEVRSPDAGSWFLDNYKGEKVPTLDEVLERTTDQSVPMIEIKEKYSKENGIEGPLLEIIRARDLVEEVIIICHEYEQVLRLYSMEPDLPLSYLAVRKGTARKAAKELPIAGVDLYHKAATPEFIEELHDMDNFVAIWTVNRKMDMHAYMKAGVDAIITDCPKLLKDVRDEEETSLTIDYYSDSDVWDESEDE